LNQAQRRNFANFKEPDLRYLLESVRQLAVLEIAEGKPRDVILTHYNQVRVGIVDAWRELDPNIPLDFGVIP
jgi:hypothetical protein